jgi:hypothetical protein
MAKRLLTSLEIREAEIEVKDATGKFLTEIYPWDWFITLTLKNPRGVFGWTKPGYASAKKAWRELVIQAQPALGQLAWVRFFEIQPWRGVPHIHALMAGVDPSVRRMDVVDWAYDRWGITRVEKYNPHLGAGYYLCKYVTKELADIDFSDNFGRR